MSEENSLPAKSPLTLTLGNGSVIVGNLVDEDLPGLYLCPVEIPGPIGSDAVAALENIQNPANAVIIRFATLDAVHVHFRRLEEMMKTFDLQGLPMKRTH